MQVSSTNRLHVTSDARSVRTGVVALVLCCCVLDQSACALQTSRASLPSILTDEAFWSLSEALSEPAGAFAHSENLVSNERHFAHTIRVLRPMNGVYLGVGPEQNFSYVARLRPPMAFIIDIRRENRNLHLMYKALFEMSADRAEFVSRLFSRERPAGLGPATSVQDLFAALAAAPPSRRLFEATAQLIRERLLHTHRFPLSPEDLDWVTYAFSVFYSEGPDIRYRASRSPDSDEPSYSTLMTARDILGRSHSYLATEDRFAFVKDLHARNLIVPVVGDFGGPDAVRRVGDYIRQHGGVLAAFYSSNVEVYLNRQQSAVFCASLAALPYDWQTWFIASNGMRPLRLKLKACARVAGSGRGSPG